MKIFKLLILTVIAITNFSGLHSMEVGDASVPLLVEASVASDVQLTVVAGGETKSAVPGGEWPSLAGAAEVKVPSDKKELTDAFYKAIEAGDKDGVEVCLDAGARSDTHPKKRGPSPIIAALNVANGEKNPVKKADRLAIIKMIHGAGNCTFGTLTSPNFKRRIDYSGPIKSLPESACTPLSFLHAAALQDPVVTAYLIDEKICDVNMLSPEGENALFLVSNIECARVLIDRGININLRANDAYPETMMVNREIRDLITGHHSFQNSPDRKAKKLVVVYTNDGVKSLLNPTVEMDYCCCFKTIWSF